MTDFFVNILRTLGYDGIHNEVCSSVTDFMQGKPAEMQWNVEEQAIDYFVSLKEEERKITILRLYFKDFSWELVLLLFFVVLLLVD